MSQDTQNLVVGIFTILVISALITFWVRHARKRARGQHWKGTVSEKKISTATGDDGNVWHTFHTMVSRAGDPKPKKITVNRASYETFAVEGLRWST